MGTQVDEIYFEDQAPSHEAILVKIVEQKGIKVRFSVSVWKNTPENIELAKQAGFNKPLPERVFYRLEHPKYQLIDYYIQEVEGGKIIHFCTGTTFFRKTLMGIMAEALLALGGKRFDSLCAIDKDE